MGAHFSQLAQFYIDLTKPILGDCGDPGALDEAYPSTGGGRQRAVQLG